MTENQRWWVAATLYKMSIGLWNWLSMLHVPLTQLEAREKHDLFIFLALSRLQAHSYQLCVNTVLHSTIMKFYPLVLTTNMVSFQIKKLVPNW